MRVRSAPELVLPGIVAHHPDDRADIAARFFARPMPSDRSWNTFAIHREKSPRRACSPTDVTGVLANKQTNCFNDRAGGPIAFPLSVNTNSCPSASWTSKYFVLCRTCGVNRGKSVNRFNFPSASSLPGRRAARSWQALRERWSIRVRRFYSQPLSAVFAPLSDGSNV